MCRSVRACMFSNRRKLSLTGCGHTKRGRGGPAQWTGRPVQTTGCLDCIFNVCEHTGCRTGRPIHCAGPPRPPNGSKRGTARPWTEQSGISRGISEFWRTGCEADDSPVNMKFFLCIQLFCILFPFSTGDVVETDKDLIAVARVWLLLKKKQKQKQARKKIKRKRTVWVSLVNSMRQIHGEYHHLMADLRRTAGSHDDEFFRYFRMTVEQFDALHERLKTKLEKKDTNYRKAITSEERLALTLRCVVCPVDLLHPVVLYCVVLSFVEFEHTLCSCTEKLGRQTKHHCYNSSVQ